MTRTPFDLSNIESEYIHELFARAQAQFPEITTDFDVWRNPDEKEHVILNVNVPFYGDERELEFRSFTTEQSCEILDEHGILVSLMPHYVAEMVIHNHHSLESA
jgi:hypothetical protein